MDDCVLKLSIDTGVIDSLEPYLEVATMDNLLTADEAITILLEELIKTIKII